MSARERGRTTVAGAVLEVFRTAGVRTAFGLPGVHNLSFWREAGPETPELMLVRHEQTAVYAADGLARATGGLGVALTTTGPGAANAVGAFGEAARSGSPVVLVASEIPTRLARPGTVRGVLHESRDQAGLFEPLAKEVLRPRTASDAVRAVARAVEVAMTWPRGPVYVDIPTDVLDLDVDDEVPAPVVPARTPADPEQLERAVALLEQAGRVVVWAGGGVVQSEASAELAAVAERLGAPVVTTFAARGVLPPEHPWLVGLPPHEPEVAALVGDADLLLVVGSELDGQMTRNWSMPRPPRTVEVDVDAETLARHEPDVAVLGDAREALASLAGRLAPRHSGDSELGALRERIRARLREDAAGGPGLGFLDAVDLAVTAVEATVVVDMTIPGYWYGGYARVAAPRRVQYPIGWGTLGYALPASVGAAAVRERPVLAICGDGGFMYAVGELAVLRQEGLPVTVLVVDDGGYGMLRFDQDRAGAAHRGVDLVRPDFVSLAAAFGIAAVRTDLDGLTDELATGLRSREPRMVVLELALTPPRTTSPRWHD